MALYAGFSKTNYNISTLEPVRTKIAQSSLSRINRLISFFTVKLLSAALQLYMHRRRRNDGLFLPPFSLSVYEQLL